MERPTTKIELDIETVYGSRGTVVEEGKVRIEISYAFRGYKEAPFPGGYVLEQSSHCCKAFMIRRDPSLLEWSLAFVYNALLQVEFDANLKEEFISKMKSAVMALPEVITMTDGVRVAPELMGKLNIEIRSVESITLAQIDDEGASAQPRRPLGRRVRRRLNGNNDSNNVEDYPSLKRIRWADISKEAEDEEWCCPVCLEKCISNDQDVIRLPCKHMYHPNCILKWLPRSCPTCRRSL